MLLTYNLSDKLNLNKNQKNYLFTVKCRYNLVGLVREMI